MKYVSPNSNYGPSKKDFKCPKKFLCTFTSTHPHTLSHSHTSHLHTQAPSRENLRIREDGVGGVFVENLSEHIVRNTAEIMSLLHEGARLRTTATTKMNKVRQREGWGGGGELIHAYYVGGTMISNYMYNI